MPSRSQGGVLHQIHRLFARGSVSGLSEWQLLDRYASRRDETAFEALVARHGPMVLGVCRRVLDDPHAVDDAFQATFLVLVRKAGTLGEHDAIGQWLYGVACRVALRARCELATRRSREVPVERADGVARGDEPGSNELAPILDEELARLPAKYRAPVVLCYLEGLTHEEAARRLGWPIGSVKGRLARARDLLRGRLARRGLAPSAGWLAATLTNHSTAAVPEPLVLATVQSALQLTAGPAAAAAISAPVIRLMEGALSAMFLTKLKVAATILGTAGCLTLGAWTLGQSSRGSQAGAGSAESQARARARDDQANGTAGVVPDWRGALDKPMALTLKDARLADVLKSIMATSQTPGNSGVRFYVDPEGLREAGASIDSPVTIDATKHPLKTALDHALRPLKLGAAVRDGLLVITSRPEVTLIELRTLNEHLRSAVAAPDQAGSSRPDELSPAAWLRQMRGHRTVYSENTDEETSPEDEARTRAVLAALQQRIPIPFPNETPLEDVIAYIKQQTKGQELPDGIPIYVDPIGLNEAEKTMTSPVTMELKGVPLREALRLMLQQVGLSYSVRDGLLTISANDSENIPTPLHLLLDKARRGELNLNQMQVLLELLRASAQFGREPGELGSEPMAIARPLRRDGEISGPARSQPSSPRPEVDRDDKLILDALERRVRLSMSDTPLTSAIERIQKLATSPGLPGGIPIYRNPTTFVAGDQRKVTLELNDVRLKTALRLILRQAGLAYTVKEGLLIIDRPNSPEIEPEAGERRFQ
jgi:RNA polymerase sigma factor (sigma-70 family)